MPTMAIIIFCSDWNDLFIKVKCYTSRATLLQTILILPMIYDLNIIRFTLHIVTHATHLFLAKRNHCKCIHIKNLCVYFNRQGKVILVPLRKEDF